MACTIVDNITSVQSMPSLLSSAAYLAAAPPAPPALPAPSAPPAVAEAQSQSQSQSQSEPQSEQPVEPLLAQEQRLTTYPILHPDVWALYQKQRDSFWTPDEIDMSKDRAQFAAMTPGEQLFVKSILAFFAGADSVVMLNLMDNFCREVPMLEAQYAYAWQAMMENIHGETYSMQIETLITDPEEKAALLSSVCAIPSVRAKIDWAQKWRLDASAPFARRLVAFAITEGLFFSGSFAGLYWIKHRNLLSGITKANEFVANDEASHTAFACLMYSKLIYTRMAQDEVHEMFRDAVAIETNFITEALPCSLIGMNAASMSEYIRFVADELLVQLQYAPLFDAKNPFVWMDCLKMSARSNFFEERVSTYQRADGDDAVRENTFVEDF